jgi:hypothetical protein
VNKRDGSTPYDNSQPQHARTERPFLASLVCAAQLKLLLLRERADAPSWHKRRCLDKLLDGVQFITQSLEGLKRADSDVPTMCPVEAASVNDGAVSAEAMQ